jgi:hypothetical protein
MGEASMIKYSCSNAKEISVVLVNKTKDPAQLAQDRNLG